MDFGQVTVGELSNGIGHEGSNDSLFEWDKSYQYALKKG